MEQETAEREIVSNEFGRVTDRRVVYFRNKGWFRGGSREDLALNQLTSVGHDVRRHSFWGAGFVLLGLMVAAGSPESNAIPAGILAMLIGGFLLWGSPTVKVTTAAGEKYTSKGWPWKRSKAEAFAKAVRQQMVS